MGAQLLMLRCFWERLRRTVVSESGIAALKFIDISIRRESTRQPVLLGMLVGMPHIV